MKLHLAVWLLRLALAVMPAVLLRLYLTITLVEYQIDMAQIKREKRLRIVR